MNQVTLKKLGVSIKEIGKYKTIEELRKQPPGMVIGVAIRDFSFSINRGPIVEFKKKTGKVLSLFVYQQLEKNKQKQKQLRPGKITFRGLYHPYNGQDLSGKTLLIWRTGGIGDLMFIQPSMRWLKKKYPTCKIYFSCSPVYTPLVENWDCYDKLVPFPVDVSYVREADYHATFEGVIERTDQAEHTNAYELFAKWLGLEIPKKELVPILKTKPEDDNHVRHVMEKFNLEKYKFIVIQLRASSSIRTISSETWGRLLTPLLKDGHKIVITDSSRMADRLDKFIKLAIPEQYHSQVVNYARFSTDISKSISLANFAQLVIAPDTSMIHIAAGLGCPVLGIYGAFPGEIRMSTYSDADWVEPPGNANVCKHNGKHCCLHGFNCEAVKPGQCAPCYNYINIDDFYAKVNILLQIRRIKQENVKYVEENKDGEEREEVRIESSNEKEDNSKVETEKRSV